MDRALPERSDKNPDEDRSDAEWPARLSSDADFERAYSLLNGRVRLVAWKISHRLDWLDEIASEVWCRAYAARDSFDPAQRIDVWLAGIARNVYREMCRRTGPAPTVAGGGALEDPDPGLEPAELAAQAEWLSELDDCVQRLPPDDACLVRWLFFEGLSGREAARRLGIAEATLRENRLPAVMGLLRKCLSEKGLRFSELFTAHDGPQSQ